jgi:bacterioferritin
LKATVKCCEEVGDYVSRDLAKRILDAEEDHIDWLETQLSLMDRVGEQNYLQTAMKTVKPSDS